MHLGLCVGCGFACGQGQQLGGEGLDLTLNGGGVHCGQGGLMIFLSCLVTVLFALARR